MEEEKLLDLNEIPEEINFIVKIKENEIDEKEYESIKESPYEYIQNFYEELFPNMGKRVMEFLSLVPISLVLPKFIDANGKENISRINYLLLSNPGTGKTSISNYFVNISQNPFPFEYITDSKLSSVLHNKDKVTVITSDIARILRDPYLSKLIENVIGDEGKLSRFTQKTKNIEEKKIDAVAYFAGTPANLYTTISDGLIFRVTPQVVFHTEKEIEEKLKKINRDIGNENGIKRYDKQKVIKYFYERLYEVQEGLSIKKRVLGYEIPQYFRDEIEKKLIPLFVKSFKSTEFEFNRELNQCYKYMISHAFLNVFNRKITNDGKLILEDKDLRVALNLSEKEVRMKTIILICINLISERKLKTLMDLDYYTKDYERRFKRKYPYLNYMILKTIIRAR